MIQKARAYIGKSEFSRQALTLMTGTSVAQLVPILIAPILTRLFSPDAFGVFTIFSSITSVLAVIASGKYEHAVTLPRRHGTALNLVAISSFLSIGFGAVIMLMSVLAGPAILRAVGQPSLKSVLYLIPITVALSGVYQSIYYWLGRKAQFSRIAKNQMAEATASGLVRIGLGFVNPSAVSLVAGGVVGQTIATTSLLWFTKRKFGEYLGLLSLGRMRVLLRRYRDFPKFMVLSGLFQTLASQLHVLMLAFFFGPVVVGYLGLTQRVIRLPMTVIAKAVGDVFKQRASEHFVANGNCAAIYLKTTKALAVMAGIPFLILIVTGPDLFGFVFGKEWAEAGLYAAIMSVMYFFQFVVSPLSNMFYVAEKQRQHLLLQLYLVTSTAAAIYVGSEVFESPKLAILFFTFAYSIKYLIEYWLGFTFAKGPNGMKVAPSRK